MAGRSIAINQRAAPVPSLSNFRIIGDQGRD
jgi:hypothetical protein